MTIYYGNKITTIGSSLIQATSVNNIDVSALMQSPIGKKYKVHCIEVYCSDNSQILNGIEITASDPDGNYKTEHIDFTIDIYQIQGVVTKDVRDKNIVIEGDTYFTGNINANTNFRIIFYVEICSLSDYLILKETGKLPDTKKLIFIQKNDNILENILIDYRIKAGTMNILKIMPTPESSDAIWQEYFVQLRKNYGLKNAKTLWLLTWEKRGGKNAKGNTSALREYMHKQGIAIDTNAIGRIIDAAGDIGDTLGGIVTAGKYVLIGTGALIVLVIFSIIYKNIKTAGQPRPAGGGTDTLMKLALTKGLLK